MSKRRGKPVSSFSELRSVIKPNTTSENTAAITHTADPPRPKNRPTHAHKPNAKDAQAPHHQQLETQVPAYRLEIPKSLSHLSLTEVQDLARYGVLEERANFLSAKIDELVQDQSSRQEAVGNLDDSVKKLEISADKLRKESTALTLATEELSELNSSLVSENADLRAKLSKLQQLWLTQSEELKQLNSEVIVRLQEKSAAESERDKVIADIDEMKAQLTKTTGYKDPLRSFRKSYTAMRKKQAELEEAKIQISVKEKKMRQEKRSFKKELKEALLSIEMLKEEKDNLFLENAIYKSVCANLKLEEKSYLTEIFEFLASLMEQEFLAPIKHMVQFSSQELETELSFFGEEIVVIGTGPFENSTMRKLFNSKGIGYAPIGSSQVNSMIVGKKDWSEEELERQLAASEGAELKIYSQEMALISIYSRCDIFSIADQDMLLALARDHEALQFLASGDIKWPNFLAPTLPKGLRPFEFNMNVDQSPLVELGYHVGITAGRPLQERKRILKNAFLDELPWVDSDEYMEQWGRPRTRRRLWRIAHHIAWFAKTRSKMPNQVHAVHDWAQDLAHLKDAYYKQWMRFKWPTYKI